MPPYTIVLDQWSLVSSHCWCQFAPFLVPTNYVNGCNLQNLNICE